ncbi:glycine/betaine ABC transporter substrate-binding protein [Agromyces rhizosphaerae]|uniref:Glycine/betaine ABC transporter substrate-binding protein n=1 Tax=Agromyces rhizosphaerae TaxID=88374 RepID=A0A9W6CV11_9MICO|nr:glycine betaine ABC transporter substrate-binding protein [Agromyces rhizosphaerae]GLI27319.1 glycine/betaine ABC transporter substrate-binding protein [Agromyces rhizosphaerae]
MQKRHLTGALALGAAGALALTGCATAGDAGSADEANNEITIAVFNGWDEGIAASELWNAILTEQGYDVTLEYADVAPVFSGLSTGDYDATFDVWLPQTHASYLEEYGDDIADLGAWNEEAALTIAVNEDAPIDSLADLADNADAFGNRIVGIEPGAGLTGAVEDSVIPTYGLEDMEFLTSSTPAMLAELTAATDAGENVIVTLWRPHWAYDAFPIKDLEDPEGTLGTAEGIHTYAKASFEDEFPEVAEWFSNFQMDSELLYSLENAMFNENDTDDYQPIVAEWIADNQEWVDSLTQ